MTDWFTPVKPEDSKFGEAGTKELTINGFTFYCKVFNRPEKVLGVNEVRDIYNIEGREPARGISFSFRVDMFKYGHPDITAEMFWAMLTRELQRNIKIKYGENHNTTFGNPQLS